MKIPLLGLFLLAAPWLLAQTWMKNRPMPSTRLDSGAAMYFSYCASCHGADGRGTGPAAKALAKPVPDLTRLSRRNYGEFPSASVMVTLGEIRGAGAHGNSQMPLWGDLFRSSGQSEGETQLRIYNLTRYLAQMQRRPRRSVEPTRIETKPESIPQQLTALPSESGGGMYKWLCAGCHGADGQGDGPALSSLKAKPSDLTQLANNNGGEFPAVKILNMLGGRPGFSAHGSREMPVWGDSFRGVNEDKTVIQLRITNLVSHLKSLQR